MSVRMKGPARNGHTDGVAHDGHADGAADERPVGAAAGSAGEEDNEGDPYIRMECGRFMPGNRGGPGNPFARHVAAMRAAISAAVPRERLMRIAEKVAEMAEKGNLAAARLLFRYCAGVPGPTPDPDTLDTQEMEGRRAATVTADDVDLIERKMPASTLCVLAHHATPEVRRAWAEDRAAREKAALGGVTAPARPEGEPAGSRRAARPEEALRGLTPPARPERSGGLPDGVDVEEALRGLAGAMREGDGRPVATSAVTKREKRGRARGGTLWGLTPPARPEGVAGGTDRR